MNNFIFENKTKVYFGKGCAKEYLTCLLKKYGNHVCSLMAAAPSRKMAFMMN